MPQQTQSAPENLYDMGNRPSKLFTTPLATQRELYQTRDSKLRECLREEIDVWGKERYPGMNARAVYADAMSVACEEHVSVAQINSWCSNEGNQIPLNKLAGHLMVTGSKQLGEIAVDGTLFSLSNQKEALFAQKGRLVQARAALEKQIALVDVQLNQEGVS